MQASDQFLSVLSEFAQSVGLPHQDDAQGIEFAAGDYTVVVFSHPGRSDSLVAEVVVTALDSESQSATALLRALHLINEAARFEHDWLIALSPEDAILLYTVRAVAQTHAAELEALLCDGIERAEALREVIAGLTGGASGDPQALPGEGPSDEGGTVSGGFGAGMLRA